MAGRAGTRTSFQTITTLMLLPIAGLMLFVGWTFVRTGENPVESILPPKASQVEPQTGPPTPPVAQAAVVTKPQAKKHRGDIVLIIDDVGFDHQPLEAAMRIDPDINFAVLPNGTRTSEFATRLNARGFEVLVHLPMEPLDPKTSPGRNAITTRMSDDEIAQTTRANLALVPHARGVNNHMGSRATADKRVMARVLESLPEGMYFIDSKTSGRSIASTLVRELNVRTASRHVFLDDVQTEDAIRRQLAALAQAAEARGVAVGIGHIYPVTVKVLADEVPNLRTRGFRLLRASAAVR